MRANPFSAKPIEPSDFELLVGRTQLMADLRQHLRFGSPRLMILLGERGSGRTSVIQALSNLSSTSYPFTFYPEQTPAQTLLNEMYCRIAGYDTPSSTNTLVEEMVAKLQGFSGDLPLISFDFPGVGGTELAQVFERLSPVLGRLRALVIVALTPAQLSAWSDHLQQQFDISEPLSDFDTKTARALIDHRIRKVSNEAWPIQQSVLEQSIAQTGGRPALLVRHLRDLIDAERGASTSFTRKSEILEAMDLQPNDAKKRMSPNVEPLESLDSASELSNETEIEFDWDIPEMEPEPEESFPEEPVEVEDVSPKLEPESELPAFEIEDENPPEQDSAGGAILQMEPGTEPPPVSQHAFGGLTQRHRTASVEIGLENALRPKSSGPLAAKPDPTIRMPEEEPQLDSEETTYWVADSLPDPDPIIESNPVMDSVAAKTIGDSLRKENPVPPSSTLPLDFERASSLSDAEISIVEAAISREVSPSDAALQAYLSVGRPRLSQIFNGLHKAGILSVRKKGRTRLFRISNQAKAHFTDGHMEA
ncbi:MAG: hypothetical protein CMJ72_03095 [Planctomycetaceae bacterium]|nr:hypothetical protein [Planctomycetaceae bacterium]